MTTTTTARETQLEQRVAELENVLAQLIRSTYSAVITHFGTGNGWEGWRRAGASHDAILSLHGFLQRHPLDEQD